MHSFFISRQVTNDIRTLFDWTQATQSIAGVSSALSRSFQQDYVDWTWQNYIIVRRKQTNKLQQCITFIPEGLTVINSAADDCSKHKKQDYKPDLPRRSINYTVLRQRRPPPWRLNST